MIARVSPTEHPSISAFLRGDSNCDGTVDLTDSITSLLLLFEGKGGACCLASNDVNGDASIDVSDPISLLGHLFLRGDAPPSPYPSCGQGPDGKLGCDRESCR